MTISGLMETLNRKLANTLGGYYRVSARGVPHVIFPINLNMSGSACFFIGIRKWKVFYPYGKFDVKQTKKILNDALDVVDYVKKLRENEELKT